jgi:hypothetical protein
MQKGGGGGLPLLERSTSLALVGGAVGGVEQLQGVEVERPLEADTGHSFARRKSGRKMEKMGSVGDGEQRVTASASSVLPVPQKSSSHSHSLQLNAGQGDQTSL